MSVLVLGGSQFIGRTIVRDLVGVGHEVAVLNRGTNPIFGEIVEQLVADRTDSAQVEAALDGRTWGTVIDVSGTEPRHLETTAHVLRRNGIGRYVFISSAAVYGTHVTGDPAPTELDPATGNPAWDEYGVDKVACETLLVDLRMPGLTILRPPYVYGPLNTLPREQFIWARILTGRPVLIPDGEPRQIQCCAVTHLSAVVAQAVADTLDPGTYNIAGTDAYSFEEYVRVLAEVAERPVTIRPVTAAEARAQLGADHADTRGWFPYRDVNLVADVSKLRRALAIDPPSLHDGLVPTLEWFRRHGDLTYAPTPLEEALGVV